MANATHRSNPKTAEITYRVYRFTEATRAKVKATRASRNMTTADLLKLAIQGELPKLVEALAHLGITGDLTEGKRRPARLPLTDSLIAELNEASEKTGIPGSLLLLASLTRIAEGTPVAPAKTTRKAKGKATKSTRK